jgi:hypothetical protein
MAAGGLEGAAMSDHPCFDSRSGCRERLFLLAEIDPYATELDAYTYNTHTDKWHNGLRQLKVAIEAAASIARIAERHGLTRVQALRFVGYPEQR